MRLSAGAGDRLHGFRFQIDLANQMILSIGDVQRLAVQHHSLRPKERSAVESAILGAVRARADGFNQRAVKFRYD